MPLTPRRATALAASLTLTALLAGCSGSSTDLSSEAGQAPVPSGAQAYAADAAAAAPAEQEAAPAAEAASAIKATTSAKAAKKAGPSSAQIAAGAGKGSGGKLSVPESALGGREIIYTAEQTIEVESVAKAVSQIEAAVDAAGGLVAKSERSANSDQQGEPASANLRMRIPPGAFDSFLERISKVGLVLDRSVTGDDVTDQVVLDRSVTGDDVTDQVVDVNSRVDSARKSATRVRALMSQATTLRDVVALESELAQRESDLEALLARQAKLKNSTELATVTVHLQEKAKPAPPVVTDEPKKGFVAGLDGGWDAFTGSAVGLATVIGALLPFAILLLVLSPVLLLLNRRYRFTARLRTPEGNLD